MNHCSQLHKLVHSDAGTSVQQGGAEKKVEDDANL